MRYFLAVAALAVMGAATVRAPGVADVVEAAPAADWVAFDQRRLMYLFLKDGGRVVVALAPEYAPQHVAQIERLVRARWWDGQAVNRVQDNYVAQWGEVVSHPLPPGVPPTLRAEWDFAPPPRGALTPVPGADGYATRVAFAGAGWPVAFGPGRGAHLAHCYGMVGVGRDEGADTGSGGELYAVIGANPRNLDRNVTLVGRVVEGIERLAGLPRGTGTLGFYRAGEAPAGIARVRMGDELPAGERLALETLRAGSPSFAALVRARAARPEAFFVNPPGHVDLCNVRPPVRRVGG